MSGNSSRNMQQNYVRMHLPFGRIKESWYDDEGKLTRININGKEQNVRREGNTVFLTDKQGTVITEKYDEQENLLEVLYPDGSNAKYKDGKPTLITELVETDYKRVTEYIYKSQGHGFTMRLKEAADSDLERISEFVYDGHKNLIMVKQYLDDGVEIATTREYDDVGRLFKITDPTGETVKYEYDDKRCGCIKAINTAQGTWQYTHSPEGWIKEITDPSGRSNRWKYDKNGYIKEARVNGKIINSYTYTKDGHLKTYQDAAGNVYRFVYNANKLIKIQIDPEGKKIRYKYDDKKRLCETFDGNNNKTVIEYKPVPIAKPSSCTPCSEKSDRTDNEFEQLQQITYPTFTKEFHYDEQGRIKEETSALNNGETSSVVFGYDQCGRLKSITNPNGITTTFYYDILGRRKKIEDPDGETVFDYDKRDRLIALTNAKGQQTRFEYNPLGKWYKEIRPTGQETIYEYDSLGRLKKIRDAKGQTTKYECDTSGRTHKISYSDGKTVILTYDDDGNLQSYNDGVTSAIYKYDILGRKEKETVNYGPFTKTFSYTYYKNNLKKTFTGPDEINSTYIYGKNNELREIQIPGCGTISIPKYRWNCPKTMIFPGGSRRTYSYDALMRIKKLKITAPDRKSLLNYQYTYDLIGNIRTKSTDHGTYTYNYDDMSRLLSVENSMLSDKEVYTYDAVGNRLTAEEIEGEWRYNDNNELLGYADVTYDYDSNGNIQRKRVNGRVVRTFIYNAENRLIKVEDENQRILAEYYYDPFGRRLWKDVDGKRTCFLYSDEGLVAEYDSDGNEIRSYGYKPDSSWTSDPLFLKQGREYYFYHNDHFGTPQKLVDVNGAIVWSARYRAFGETILDTTAPTITNNLRFPGQYEDEETGLHYNYHRYYDPKIGRYLRKDPIGMRGGMNLFVYSLNNPIKHSDPLGLGVHPHQIVSFDEACSVVEQQALSYRLIERQTYMWMLTKKTSIPGMETHSIRPKDYPFFYKALLLNWLGNQAFKPGGVKGRSGFHNRFVFTCKYGWIDMGHFFISAALSYQMEPLPDNFIVSILKNVGEWFQYIIRALRGPGNPTSESAGTIEDWFSNERGAKFGLELAKEHDSLATNDDYLTWARAVDVQGNSPQPDFVLETLWVVQKWRAFLHESEAIRYSKDSDEATRGSDVYGILRADARSMWDEYDDSLTDPNEEDPDAVFRNEFRKPWDEVKHRFRGYREYC